MAHNLLVFTDVLNTSCSQEANCITVGLNVVVNKCAIEQDKTPAIRFLRK